MTSPTLPVPSATEPARPAAASALAVDGVSMAFDGVPVLHDVTLSFPPGSILGLVGENGAGKSTLMKIVSGLLRPTGGTVLVDGRPERFGGPLDARRAGVCLIPQEFNLAGGLNVYENIFLGWEPRTRLGLLDRAAMRRRAGVLLDTLGALVPPDAPLDNLSAADRQLVEIAKALSHDARLLILDEPTSVLAGREIDALFERMRGLQARGVSQVYISHKLREVKTVCDRLAVLRDGRLVATADPADWSVDEIARRMVGRELNELFPEKPSAFGPELLRVEGLCVPGVLGDISFAVRAGEVFGLAGLVGSGRTELAETLMGLRRAAAGRITFAGRPARWTGPRGALAAGLSYLSEDRQGSGILTAFSSTHNITLSSLSRYGRLWPSRSAERVAAQAYAERFRLKTPSLDAPLSSLSGGNQQKVSLAKSVDTLPKLLIADEPTRGVDLGARRELYRHLRALAGDGLGLIVISSELEEVIGLANRIGVMRGGRLAAVLEGGDLNETEIMLHATGAKHPAPETNSQLAVSPRL